MSRDITFGPWPQGIDNIHKPNDLPVDQFGQPQALTDALNVDISPTGFPSSRLGQKLRLAMAGAHSAVETAVGVFFVQNSTVYALNSNFAATAVTTLNSNDPTSFDDYLGGVIVSNRTTLKHIKSLSSAEDIAIPDGIAPGVAAQSSGGLLAGLYGVAIAYLRNGKEGALSAIQTVVVAEGGGLLLSITPASGADAVRIFRTDTNGTVLFHTEDVPINQGTFRLGATIDFGKNPEFQFKRAMPCGDFVNSWRGRVLVAIGRTLWFSEPYAGHITDRRHNFVQFPRKINFVRGVQEGVFVGTREDVFFLPGEHPREWKAVSTGGQPAASRGAILVDGSDLDEAYRLSGQNVAVWLSTSGFVLGTADGTIIEPQASRYQNALPQQASIAYLNRRLTAVIS